MSSERGGGQGTDRRFVVGLDDVDRGQVGLVGGKAAHLGELSRVEGVRVPPGFCVTTRAFERFMASAPALAAVTGRIAAIGVDDQESIRAIGTEIRGAMSDAPFPEDVAAEVIEAMAEVGEGAQFAVRSSATLEDSPAASAAGQHDTYLNVSSPAVLDHIKRCWESTFTDRAIVYRLHNGVDPVGAGMAVVVQQMLDPEASGVLFTADPVTSNRRVVSIEAVFGLGEALVAGTVGGDVYRVRSGEIVESTVATKRSAVVASPEGGTRELPIESGRQTQQALSASQVVELAELGRLIEAHFGRPQDIEWCLTDDGFAVVQSRPITSLFPIPAGDDGANHVYISVGHQQMMTDAMKPLGLSFWQLTTRAPMKEAGGRLFVDVTQALSSPASRVGLLSMAGRSDPLIRDALETVVDRGDFLPPLVESPASGPVAAGAAASGELDPGVVEELIAGTRASLEALEVDIATKSGPALFEFIADDLSELQQLLFDRRSYQAIMAAMEATWWLHDHLEAWLGENGVADSLAQSAPNNVTSEMGLALLEVADAIRPHPEVVAFLEHVDTDGFLDELSRVTGGKEAVSAIRGFLDTYGMRCVGEIDITRPRWAERPTTLVPLILANVKNFEPGAAARRFAQGRLEAERSERDLLARLRDLPDGASKAAAAKEMIDRMRAFIGYREYPKYGMISRYFIYKKALMLEAEELVSDGVITEPDDIFYLRFEELHEAVRTKHVEPRLIDRRRLDHQMHGALRPPRVLTSEGEALDGAYRRDDVPPGALMGLPVSTGVVEGRARVVEDLAGARIEPGDILVTAHTDPSWSPVFVTVSGLITEVGGLMTHGAVVAREYGLPAVVGVEHATTLIADGQQIRLDGTNGFITILDR